MFTFFAACLFVGAATFSLTVITEMLRSYAPRMREVLAHDPSRVMPPVRRAHVPAPSSGVWRAAA